MRRSPIALLLPLFAACHAKPESEAREARSDAQQASAPAAKSELTHDERMAWWREARFGMFIHWGLYAIPAGKWGDSTGHGEWIRTTARIPLEEYAKFQPQFNPTAFDADAWARMAAEAGLKYLVITSKHHDGFALFDSKLTDWDVMNTPFGRDVLKELSEACERRGVKFCTYHSIMDWHHPDYLPRREWETERSSDGADFTRFRQYLHGQVEEVVRNYEPAVMWFDGEWESTWTHEFGLELFEHCRKLAPAMLVNNRVDVHRAGMAGFSQSNEAVGDFGTPEQEIPATGMPGVDWETCMTMNDHWGFNAYDTSWKSSREMIRMLVDVASKGGNYLLNVGPRADGTFPPEAIERLREIGAWTKRYGAAVHGTQASPFDALPWGRCTLKRNGDDTLLYLHVFERPANDELVLPGIGNQPLSAGYLVGPRVLLPVERRGADLVVRLLAAPPDENVSVVTLGLRGAPIVYRAPTISAAAEQFLRPLQVSIEVGAGLAAHYTLDGSTPTAESARSTGPLELTNTTRVRAVGVHEGRVVTSEVERTFTRATPRPALDSSGAQQGLRREKFAGEWERLPDFGSLTALESVISESIGFETREERVGYRFSGLVVVDADDVYDFSLASDDGSRLWIDGELVVDNDGLHATVDKRGQIALAAGAHALRVDWFNRTGGAELSVRAARVGQPLLAIPRERLLRLP
jgi:alpha-L-fucosidase